MFTEITTTTKALLGVTAVPPKGVADVVVFGFYNLIVTRRERQMRNHCPGIDRPNLLAEIQVLMIAAQEKSTSRVHRIAHPDLSQS